MFTGIIEEIGVIESVIRINNGLSLIIPNLKIYGSVKVGDSIAVNGVCLTVSDLKNGSIIFNVMSETIKKTNISRLKKNDKVNIERALPSSGRLDGHFVQGHIDCVGKLISKRKVGASETIEISYPSEFCVYTAPRGSIAIDGVSLTVAEKNKNIVKIGLVEFTLKHTTLGAKKIGDYTNIEFDIIGKYLFEFYKRNNPK